MSGRVELAGRKASRIENEESMSEQKDIPHEACCAEGSGTPDRALDMFQDFMSAALKPGALDVVTKELIAVALGLAVNCVPCSKIHIRKARDMGIGDAELEEAAALAAAFGGCRAMMLWNELKEADAGLK
ncbi:MAG: carboxymuconolactone decarboxylase family protein [Acidobacteriota bacterium]|nr:carboxymuconolactone decarboxylase family protein [Acidobacteriota bacterium]